MLPVIVDYRYLEQFIRCLRHLALNQSKKLSVSQTFAYVQQISRSLEQFSLGPLSSFLTPAATITAIVPEGTSKDSQINFFCYFFDRII